MNNIQQWKGTKYHISKWVVVWKFYTKKKERFSLFEPKLKVHNLAPSYGFLPFIVGVIKTLSCFMVCTFQMSQTESHLDEHARPKIYNFQIPCLTCLRLN